MIDWLNLPSCRNKQFGYEGPIQSEIRIAAQARLVSIEYCISLAASLWASEGERAAAKSSRCQLCCGWYRWGRRDWGRSLQHRKAVRSLSRHPWSWSVVILLCVRQKKPVSYRAAKIFVKGKKLEGREEGKGEGNIRFEGFQLSWTSKGMPCWFLVWKGVVFAYRHEESLQCGKIEW